MIKEFTNGLCIPDTKPCIIFLFFFLKKKVNKANQKLANWTTYLSNMTVNYKIKE